MGKAPPRQKARLVASGPILPDPPGPLPSSILVHSARTIEKATLVAIENPPEAGTQSIVQSGNALAKFSFLRRLPLQPGKSWPPGNILPLNHFSAPVRFHTVNCRLIT